MGFIMLGRGHALVRRIRALRRDPVLRRSERVLLAEGLHLAQEALAAAAPIEQVVVSSELGERAEGRRLLERIAAAGLPSNETSPEVLRSLQDARSPQPVLMVVGRPSWSLDACLEGAETIAVGHTIQDPGNLGAMLRTAAASGAAALLVCGESADLYHPRTVRAGMGAVFRMPAIAVEAPSVFGRLRARGIRLIGADPAAESSYLECDLAGPSALVFGGEGPGLRSELRDQLDETVRIPMRRSSNSLSVGAAAAVLLYEAARQRSARSAAS